MFQVTGESDSKLLMSPEAQKLLSKDEDPLLYNIQNKACEPVKQPILSLASLEPHEQGSSRYSWESGLPECFG